MTAVGQSALVKSVLTSQAVYHLMTFFVYSGMLQAIDKIGRPFLWEGTDNAAGEKCKVNWDAMCRPKELGGLGVLHIPKFAPALRLRWPWYEWTNTSKTLVRMGNPCDAADIDLLYASMTISVGNGRRGPFWDSAWLVDQRLKIVAPLIYEASRRKNWSVHDALQDEAWIRQINLENGLTAAHIQQFIDL
jgi:hypothetical protein